MRFKLITVLLLLSSGAWAAIAHVNGVNAAAAAFPGNTSTTFPLTMTAGNTIFGVCGLYNNGQPVPTVTDDAGDTFTSVRFGDPEHQSGVSTFYSFLAANVVGGSRTITVSTYFNALTTCIFSQFSGLGTNPIVNIGGAYPGSFNSGSSFSTFVSGSLTPSAGDLLIGFGGSIQSASVGASCAAGSGYTQPAEGSIASSNGYGPLCLEYNLSASAGSTTASQSFSGIVLNASFGYALISITPNSTPSAPVAANWLLNSPAPGKALVCGNAPSQSFPLFVRVPSNGNLLLFMKQAASGQGSSAGAVGMCTSTDNGKTWTAFSGTNFGCQPADYTGCVFSGTGTANDWWQAGQPTVSYDGVTVVVPILVLGPNTGYGWVKLLVSTSTDGVTWTTPTTAYNAGGAGGTGNGNILAIPAGGVSSDCPNGCLVTTVTDNSPVLTWEIVSFDNGATWPNKYAIAVTGVALNQEEGDIYYAGGNSLIGFFRSLGESLIWMYSPHIVSPTWTLAYSNILPGPPLTGTALTNSNTQIVDPHFINPNLGDGKISAVYGERQSTNGSGIGGGGRLRIMTFLPSAAIANPGAFGQDAIVEYQTISIETSGYSGAVQLSGNTWLLAYMLGVSNSALFTQTFTYVCPTCKPTIRAPQMFASVLQ